MRVGLLRGVVAGAMLALGVRAQALDGVPKAEFHARREALAAKLEGGVAVLFATEEPTDELTLYRQDSDFFYLTGWTEPGAALVVIAASPATTAYRTGEAVPAQPYREILFLPERNRVMEKYTGEKMNAVSSGVTTATGVDEVKQVSELPTVLAQYLGANRYERLRRVYEQTDMPQATAVMSFVGTALGSSAPPPEHDVRTLTMALREVKSPAELTLLREAAEASIAGQLAGMRAIKPGVLEQAVAGAELGTFMAEGCERWSYPPIVGSGFNSTVLHYSSNSHTMDKGGLVVIDAACERRMYASDITRTMPVDGHFTARQKEIYEIVLGAQRAAAAAFVAGKSRMGSLADRTDPAVTDSLDKVAYDYINTHGKDLHGEPLGKYFAHGLGHSVGIDVHDPMDYAHTRLDKGMVFTIEPGIYIPEEKLGVRIEDVFYVDDNGKLEEFIAKLPHEPADVEAAMRH